MRRLAKLMSATSILLFRMLCLGDDLLDAEQRAEFNVLLLPDHRSLTLRH
jgi:hypothetical protein